MASYKALCCMCGVYAAILAASDAICRVVMHCCLVASDSNLFEFTRSRSQKQWCHHLNLYYYLTRSCGCTCNGGGCDVVVVTRYSVTVGDGLADPRDEDEDEDIILLETRLSREQFADCHHHNGDHSSTRSRLQGRSRTKIRSANSPPSPSPSTPRAPRIPAF